MRICVTIRNASDMENVKIMCKLNIKNFVRYELHHLSQNLIVLQNSRVI